MRLRRHRRALLGILTSAVLLGGTVSAAPAEAAPSRPTRDALGWLKGELEQGHFVSGGFDLYGPTLDYFFALIKFDAKPNVRTEILDSLRVHRGDYIGSGGDTYAGATGKLLSAVIAEGIDPDKFANGSLVPRLRKLVHLDADSQRGRVIDDSTFGDFSNTVGQTWDVRAFAGMHDPLLRVTTKFLLKQQCNAGYFRESEESSDHTCQTGRAEGKSDPSVDTTALAVMALKAARHAGIPKLGDDIRAAITWLRKQQNPNGSFTGNGAPNANSTGLAAWVLADAGVSNQAARAASWLRDRQVTPSNADGTELAGDVGAVAYNRKAFRDGKSDGITDGDVRSQWIVATAQAAVALDALR